jgi:hypothetical protein
MKKIIIFVVIFIGATAGYLYYDWHAKTKRLAEEPSPTLYSWTDEKGVKHFTDKTPPIGAQNVSKAKGFKYVKPPLAITLKQTAVNLYRRVTYAVSDFFRNIIKKSPKKNRK